MPIGGGGGSNPGGAGRFFNPGGGGRPGNVGGGGGRLVGIIDELFNDGGGGRIGDELALYCDVDCDNVVDDDNDCVDSFFPIPAG